MSQLYTRNDKILDRDDDKKYTVEEIADAVVKNSGHVWSVIPSVKPNTTYYEYVLGTGNFPELREPLSLELDKLGYETQYQSVCTTKCDSYYGCNCPVKYLVAFINKRSD